MNVWLTLRTLRKTDACLRCTRGAHHARSTIWRRVTVLLQDLLYNKMMADSRVSPFFEGIDMKQQRAHQVGLA